MTPKYFILKNKQPVETDANTWADFVGLVGGRMVLREDEKHHVKVVTHFVGLCPDANGNPRMFQTDVEGGKLDGERTCCALLNDALCVHTKLLADSFSLPTKEPHNVRVQSSPADG